MPGIRVPTAGQFDWMRQREDPLLTVPGSYWLCHKQNIYKFIFRYHRSLRNLKDFPHGRELMKVIRRIIKCQPRQGQQFSTRHLLVTYNHTSWTRQDKMFAMLKFKERSDAAAYTHAFVLTVKIISLETTESRVKCPTITLHSNDSLIAEADSVENVMECENENDEEIPETLTYPPETVLPKQDLSREYGEGNAISDSHDRDAESDIITKLQSRDHVSVNKEKTSTHVISSTDPDSSNTSIHLSPKQRTRMNQSPSKSNITSNSKSWESRSPSHTLATPAKMEKKVKTCSKQLVSIHKKNDDGTAMNETRLSTENNGVPLSCKLDVNKTSFAEKVCCEQSINDAVSDSNSTTDESVVDSANLPYQYLIEKEIEDAKNKKTSTTSPNTRSSSKAHTDKGSHDAEERKSKSLEEAGDGEKHSADPAQNFTETQNFSRAKTNKFDRQKHRVLQEAEKKYVSDSKASRSSDITDLVMEGLMFTIRQEEDSVAVIEQKTKLEVDEVLENSEKVETKQGEKRLRNSSLLGLENLITMIKVPEESEEKRRNERPNIQTNLPQPFSNSTATANTNFADDMCLLANDKAMNITAESVGNGLIGEDDLEEEDIIPEALQRDTFNSSVFSNENEDTRQRLINRDLLMDDMDVDESVTYDAESAERGTLGTACANDASMNSNYIYTKPSAEKKPCDSVRCKMNSTFKFGNDGTGTRETKLPRVVSSQIITVDEMPVALQLALKSKLARRGVASNSESDSSISNSEIQGHKFPCNVTDTSSAELNTLNCDTSEESLTPPHTPDIKSTLPPVSEQKVQNSNKFRDTEPEEVISHVQRISTLRLKQLAPKRMQDVTKEFYRELLQVQKKDSSVDQRCLRQRRKPAHTFSDVKDEEIRVEMLKLIHDITRGAKVVVQRMSTKSISSIIGKSSSLATCMH